MDEVFAYFQQIDPLWSVVLVAAALGILLIARFWRASFMRVLALVALVLFVGAAAAGGFYGYEYFEDMRRLDERRALDERAAVLLSKAVEPDSVFACIDGSPVPAMQEACERSLFAEPQHVAATVAIVTQRLAFLADAVQFARERDPDYLDNIEPLRKAMEADPYGFVGFVLSVEHNCIADSCARLAVLRDPSRVKENMRGRRLEAHLAKYAAAWRGSSVLPADTAPASGGSLSSPLITISGDTSERREESGDAANVIAPLVQPPSAATAAAEPPAAASAPLLQPSAEAEGFAEPPRLPEPPARAAAAKGKGKDKAKAAAAPARSGEPVAGLPRVVPGDYVREREEEARAEAAARPGAPTPISPPQQNFNAR